jgi:hypothetical protein
VERDQDAVAGDDVALGREPRVSFTWRRSTEESTNRTVPPTFSSPITCQGSRAWRSSSSISRQRTRPSTGKPELEVGGEPALLERQAPAPQVGDDLGDVGLEEMRQHEAVVQLGAPAGEPARRERVLPEAGDQRPQEQLLDEAHPRVRRHLEGPELQEPEAAGRAVGRVELVDAELGAVGVAGDVDQEVAEDAVDEPRGAGARGVARRGELAVELQECDLELVDAVVARLVDPGALARGADEEPAEEVAERGVLVPVGEQALQQVGPAQERAVLGPSGPRGPRGCRRPSRRAGRRP